MTSPIASLASAVLESLAGRYAQDAVVCHVQTRQPLQREDPLHHLPRLVRPPQQRGLLPHRRPR